MRRLSVILGMLLLLSPAVAQAQAKTVKLEDAQAKTVGTATLRDAAGGVAIAVRVSGLKPGAHGFHIHAVGKCEPPAFASAGGHFNPGHKKHGHKNPEGAHAGDLPNLTVGANGAGALEATAAGVTFKDVTGLALVVHADPDDEKTDPTGNSGARVACGVIQ